MPVGPGSTAHLHADQARLDRFAPIGIWVVVAGGALVALLGLAEVHYYRALWHWFHVLVRAVQQGRPAPTQPSPPAWSPIGTVLSLATGAAEVTMLVWQYRAARVAQALGYPARRSPGWGVGCWFVPVVNLWMPYQAIRDCLPPGHPGRPRVLVAWLLYLGYSIVVAPAAIVTVVVAPTLGVVLVGVALAVEVAIGWNASRAVRDIVADHREAVVGGAAVR